MSDQLPLFETAPERDDGAAAALAAVHAEARGIAAGLPDGVRYGTSSWSFPGWKGIVYSGGTTTALARDGLREYARHPLLTTVGIDRSYYAPIPVDDLRHYASQLPAGFPCCAKAPAAVTALTLGGPGAGGTINPDFLSADRLVDDLLNPLALAFRAHAGPVILEFPPFPRGHRMAPGDFLARLDRLLDALPREFEYAVELRDSRLLTPAYRDILARHGVAHTFNYWSAMPMPAAQAAIVPVESLPFAVVRLLLRPGTWYEDQRDRFKPFNALVAPDPVMRDEVTAVTLRGLAAGRRVYVLVNNKAEGSSPLTVQALASALRSRWAEAEVLRRQPGDRGTPTPGR